MVYDLFKKYKLLFSKYTDYCIQTSSIAVFLVAFSSSQTQPGEPLFDDVQNTWCMNFQDGPSFSGVTMVGSRLFELGTFSMSQLLVLNDSRSTHDELISLLSNQPTHRHSLLIKKRPLSQGQRSFSETNDNSFLIHGNHPASPGPNARLNTRRSLSPKRRLRLTRSATRCL